MMDDLHLKIADLHIVVSCDQLPILQVDESVYLDFVEEDHSPSTSADIEVQLEIGHPLDTAGWTKTFDDDQSWQIFRRGGDYAMQFTPLHQGNDPLWVAYFEQDCSQVVIRCNERLIDERNGEQRLLNPVRYPLDQHLMMYHLADRGGILIHAAGFLSPKGGLVFPGRSGAGKSTISRFLSRQEGWSGLSDDRMLLRQIDSEIFAYGTPWPGEEGMAENKAAKLSGLYFLCHALGNNVSSISASEAIQKLMPVVSIPWYDEEMLAKLLPLCADILSQVPAYELCFKPTQDIGPFLDEFLSSARV
jgi:hypothetical protein